MPVIEHLRITALGTLGIPPAESFSYGFNMVDTSDPVIPWFSDATNPAYADIAADIVAFHGRPGSLIHPQAVLTAVKIARIVPDPTDPDRGIYSDDPIIKVVNQAGGAAAALTTLPQSALVASFNTDQRGPTGKGRFYIPMPNINPTYADGFKVASVLAEGVRTSVVTLLDALNNWPGPDFGSLDVCVVSSKGYANKVTSVRVGRIVDTMQSRRRALGEAYTANAAVA